MAQAAILAYLALYARETYAVSAVGAGRLLALAQVGGTLARLGAGWASDRFLGGRRRPGVVTTALTAALAFGALALGPSLPAALAVPVAFLAGAGAPSAGSASTSRWWPRSAARGGPACSPAWRSSSRGRA
jgi:sugar phosphate permease